MLPFYFVDIVYICPHTKLLRGLFDELKISQHLNYPRLTDNVLVSNTEFLIAHTALFQKTEALLSAHISDFVSDSNNSWSGVCSLTAD